MPEPLTPHGRRLLEVVWRSTHDGRRPTFATIDKILDAENLDAAEIMSKIDSRLLYAERGLVPQPQPGDQIGVSALGLTYLDPQPTLLTVFLSCLQYFAEVERSHEPTVDEPEPVVTSEQFADYLRQSTAGIRPLAVARQWSRLVGDLLRSDGRPWTTLGSSPDAEWRVSIGRGVRKFREVTTAEQYADTFPEVRSWPLTQELDSVATEQDPLDPSIVFVVYGRNEAARAGVFAFLRSLGLKPIEWERAVAMTEKASPYVGEILDVVFGKAAAVVIVQTPDDVAYLHPSLSAPGDPACRAEPQPRPNVLFEAGMAMGRQPDRTVFVELGTMRSFSDIHGRHVVRLEDSVASRQRLAERLKNAGCAVDMAGSDWHTAGDLTPPPAPGNGLPLGRVMPSAERAGVPQLDARFIDNGERKLGAIEVTNRGPGDVLDLNVSIEQRDGLSVHLIDGLPVPRLPQGKSVRPVMLHQFGSGPPYLTVTVTGRTAEGTELTQDIFVSGI